MTFKLTTIAESPRGRAGAESARRGRALALLLPALLLLASCSREAEQPAPARPKAASSATLPAAEQTEEPKPSSEATAPVTPPAPGTPGGLPDDRTPISEAPFTPTSAQGAANVVQIYYALISEGRYENAWRLWTEGGHGSGMTADAFSKGFAAFASYNANIGAPGEIEGAAGSLYVSVPVQVYGRRKSGEPVYLLGQATLRRVNDVPGSTPEQREWHISRIELKPTPGPAAETPAAAIGK